MTARTIVLVVVAAAAGCPASKPAPAPAGPTPPDDAALCADLDRLVSTAATNFAGQRTETPVRRGDADGVALERPVTGAQNCAVLHPDPAYPDDMIECDLADAGSMARAREVVAAWTARIGRCAVVSTWASRPGADGSHEWAFETDDNHLLEIQLGTSGEAPDVRPILQLRRPEI